MTKEFKLENFDGHKAYLDRTEYRIIYNINGRDYAFPNHRDFDDAERFGQESPEKTLPTLLITSVDVDLSVCTGRPVNVSERESIERYLESVSKDLE